MLKISENAWHYKLHNIVRDPVNFVYDDRKDRGWLKYDSVYKRQPNSLCSYFWSTVLCILLTIVGAILAVAIALLAVVTVPIWGVIVLIVYFAHKLYLRRKENKKKQNEEFKKKYIEENGWEAWLDYYWGHNKPPKEPNLLWEFIKAKKNRVCPLIEIVKEEKPVA